MTPKHTNPARTPPRNYIETFRNLSEDSTENMDLQDYMIGASYTTTACSPQETHPLHPGFYGLPKIHKTNCPMRPIVLSLWDSHIPVSQILDQNPPKIHRDNSIIVKDSKSFSDHLRMVEISGEEELVSFDISALFTSIPVPTALDVINRLFTEHIEDPDTRDKYGCSFKRNTIGLEKDEVMSLLKLVLENCVFTFQNRFYKQLHGAAMGSPCSPVVAKHIYGIF